ncbi:hypothetical protein BGX28_003192, partial [Mortierella sp. GBA30]
MRPPTKYEAAQFQSSKKSTTSLRLRPRRRSLIGRSRAVPFLAGSLGSHHRRPEDGADDQLIVSLRDRNLVDTQTGAPLQSNPQALQEYLMVLAPQRLPYEIQMASGWDTGYAPEELVGLMQKSAGKGWHTPRFCTYPQDLVLRFSCGHSRIRKIQILSHQYKIASRLDFWMGSRKGVQSISTDPTDDRTHSVGGDEADLATYREHVGSEYDEEDDGLDLIPRMPVQKNLPVLQFQKLGSISFDSNAASNYSGRELRSINFDVEGEYLRVVIRQCHVNPLNIYHQVAILALNVLGEPLEDELLADSERLDFDECEVVNGPGHGFSETSLAHSAVPTSEISVNVHNLASAVPALSVAEVKEHTVDYMDQEIQKLAAGFVKAKLSAVKVEDFQSAKLYKAGYDEILKFADQVQELDVQKQQAAEQDDFDLAQELKAKVADVKAKMHSQLVLSGFFITSEDDQTVVSLMSPDTAAEDVGDETSFLASKSFSTCNVHDNVDNRNTSSGSIASTGRRIPISRRSVPPPSDHNRRSPATSDSSDLDKMKREDYAGKISLPPPRSLSMGLSRKPQDDITRSRTSSPYMVAIPRPYAPEQTSQSYIFQDEDSIVPSEELTEQEQKTFAVSLQVFSGKIISCLISRELHLRQHAIEHVKEYLENENDADDIDQHGDRTLLAKAAFQVISAALADTREKVVTITLALLDQAVKYCLQNEIPNSVAYRSLEPIFSQLLIKASDLNTRVAKGAVNRIVMLCNCFRSHPYAILPLVFRPAKGTVLYKHAESRVEIVARLVDEFGVYDSTAGKGTPGGLDFENITEFAVPYLSHTNGEVRIATRKLIIDVCKFLNKTRVEQFLPGVKPLIIESIQKELVPKKTTIAPGNSPALSRSSPTSNSSMATGPNSRVAPGTSGSGKRRPIPTPLGVNLHMDSLKSLLVEPDSPGFSKSSRQSSRQRSETALAHQARLKMPLRQTAKATQAIYTGVPRTMVKKQSALSPDDENDSTASEETKIIEVPTLADHMLKECSRRKFVKQCENCKEIMPADTFLAHVAAGCIEVPSTVVRCPLCQIIMSPSDEAAWKRHLMQGSGCPMNKKSANMDMSRSQSYRSDASRNAPAADSHTSAVNKTRRYTTPTTGAPTGSSLSPTSPASSSSSSTRVDTSFRYAKGASPFSMSVSAASSTSSLVGMDKSVTTQHKSVASSFSASTSAVSRHHPRTPYGHTSEYQHQSDSGHPSSYSLRQRQLHPSQNVSLHLQDAIHPFDPVPSLPSGHGSSSSSVLTQSTSMNSLGSGSVINNNNSSNSRIPKLGTLRSVSTNS